MPVQGQADNATPQVVVVQAAPEKRPHRVLNTVLFILGSCVALAFLGNVLYSSDARPTPTVAVGRNPVPGGAIAVAPTPTPDKASAEAIDPRALTADAAGLTGRNVVLVGEALTVTYNRDGSDPHTWVQLMAQVKDRPGITEPIVVEVRPLNTAILRAECYRIYGMTAGTQRVTRSLTGATNEAPLVNGYLVEPIIRDKSSRCGA